jgi:hypothetical protein
MFHAARDAASQLLPAAHVARDSSPKAKISRGLGFRSWASVISFSASLAIL